jgi:hypothetical protein
VEELLIALFSGLADLVIELFSCLGGWWTPWDAELLSPGVLVPLLCILGGAGSGWLSTLVLKHALLSKPWMRIATLIGLPPVVGWQCHRLEQPSTMRTALLRSPRFWLPLLVVLSFCAARLVAIDR